MTRQRILVIDDRREVADALAMLIKSLGYPAQTVYSGRSVGGQADLFNQAQA